MSLSSLLYFSRALCFRSKVCRRSWKPSISYAYDAIESVIYVSTRLDINGRSICAPKKTSSSRLRRVRI